MPRKKPASVESKGEPTDVTAKNGETAAPRLLLRLTYERPMALADVSATFGALANEYTGSETTLL